jgi:hypothetical protein
MDGSFVIPESQLGTICDYPVHCICNEGPVQNSGSDVVTGSLYVTSIIENRRKFASSRLCVPGQLVSWEFLSHLETIADTNGDGNLTASGFRNARNASFVLLNPGCTLAPRVAANFPNMRKIDACGSVKLITESNGKRRFITSSHHHKKEY